MFVAECPSLPGCISQGKSRKEALKNIKDVIVGYIESLKKHGEGIPPPIDEEIVEVNFRRQEERPPSYASSLFYDTFNQIFS